MVDTRFDVLGIGNAIVDVIAHADDTFLERNDLVKGAMTLIDVRRAGEICSVMAPAIECSGGSAANTVAGVAALHGTAAFIGKVCNDELGMVFRHDIQAAGVTFDTSPAFDGAPTARCLVFVTPDAQRTMQTFLGACVELGPDDIESDLVESAKITYLEGYLWDPPQAKEAFVKAAELANQAGRKVALTLSDPFCVDRHREEFLGLVQNHIDILFANEAEIESLYQVDSFDDALQEVRRVCEVAALTRSERGSVIVANDEVHVIDADPVEQVVDTTGAGDLYASGVLYGLTNGYNLRDCGRIGGIAAAEVINHDGARPSMGLAQMVQEKLA